MVLVLNLQGWARDWASASRARWRKRRSRERGANQSGGRSGVSRSCFRCGRRSNNCMARGCLPYKWKLPATGLQKMKRILAGLDQMKPSRRFGSDNVDLQVLAKWCKATVRLRGTKSAVLGLLIASHFGNNLLTMGFVSSALVRSPSINWGSLAARLQQCRVVCGKLHSPCCRPFSAPRVASRSATPTEGMRYAHVFRAVFGHPSFTKACRLLATGVLTHGKFNEVYDLLFHEVRREVPGCLAPYHFKLLLDSLIAGGLLPRGCVAKWPVAKASGTAKSILDIYGIASLSETQLGDLLNELFHRLRAHGCLQPNDFQGTVGAALCWSQRMGGGSGRYGRAARQAELELHRLQELAIPIEPLRLFA